MITINFEENFEQLLKGEESEGMPEFLTNTITMLILMIDYFNKHLTPFNEEKVLQMKRFFKLLQEKIRRLKQLPNEFYDFWTTLKNDHNILNEETLFEEIVDIDEILSFKSGSNILKKKTKNSKKKFGDCNLTFNSRMSYFPSSSSNQLPYFYGKGAVISQKYESYSLKGQINFDEIKCTHLAPTAFEDEKEVEGVNIVYNDNKEIVSISLNLFLKKIATDPAFEIKPKSVCLNELINGFCQQFIFFIPTDSLLTSISQAIDHFISIKPDQPPFNLVSFLNLIIIKQFKNEIAFDDYLREKLCDIYQNLGKNDLIKQKFSHVFSNMKNLFEAYDDYDISCIILELLGRQKRNVHSLRSSKVQRTTPVNTFISSTAKLMDWEAKEIAQELTHITGTMLDKIDENELLLSVMFNKERKVKAPNVYSFVERFDKLSYFIIEEVLAYDKKKLRAKMIEKFIDVENELFIMGNFNDCMNIKSCLNHFIIQSLTKTWKVVDKEHKNTFNTLNKKLSIEKNFKALREEIEKYKNLSKPYIPYFGLVLKELTFNEEGPRYVDQSLKMLNAEKIRKINGILSKFFRFKENTLFVRHISGLEILFHLNPKDERELEEIKNCLEPLFTLAKTKITVKRMTKTDITMMNKARKCFCVTKKASMDTSDSSSLFCDETDDGYEGDDDLDYGKISTRNRYGNMEKKKMFVLSAFRKETK